MRMNYHISLMVRLVNGDLGVVYHKVNFCEMKCIQEYELNLAMVLGKYSFCFMSAKRVCAYVNPANQEKDIHI